MVASALYDRYLASAPACSATTPTAGATTTTSATPSTTCSSRPRSRLSSTRRSRSTRRFTHHGDLEQACDPDSFSSDTDRDIDQDSFRGGVRWSPTPNSDLLLSFIYSDTDDKEGQGEATIFGDLDATGRFKDKGYQPEIQHIYHGDLFNLTTGAAYYYVDRKETINLL